MANLSLSVAVADYDHVRDLVQAKVRAQGLDLIFSDLAIEEILFRMGRFLEWDAAEFSMGQYVSLLGGGDPPFLAIPVFTSRMFRQCSIYVRTDAGIRSPKDLAGRRIGVPEWAQGAGVYIRGYLQHQCGVRLSDIEWVQSGVNQAGRAEKVSLHLPDGIRITPIPDRSLMDLLIAGELDAVFSAREPAAFLAGHPRVGRLFPNYREVEENYYRETGIFPIMHTIVIKRGVLERHPWVAMNLFKAFEEAKVRSLARVAAMVAPGVPIPWCYHYAEQARQIFGGGDYWPYGIEPNRPTLEAFLTYCYEQGVSRRKIQVDEFFAKELSAFVKV